MDTMKIVKRSQPHIGKKYKMGGSQVLKTCLHLITKFAINIWNKWSIPKQFWPSQLHCTRFKIQVLTLWRNKLHRNYVNSSRIYVECTHKNKNIQAQQPIETSLSSPKKYITRCKIEHKLIRSWTSEENRPTKKIINQLNEKHHHHQS